MVSTSTAAVPISLESSQSLATPTPLAIRRGQNLPAPLMLSPLDSVHPSTVRKEGKPDTSLYPGIPTPFLGSPTKYTPSFECSSNDAALSMDLDVMCGSLRSLCPPLRSPDVFPPLPPLPTPGPPAPDGDPNEYMVEIPSIDSNSDEWTTLDSFLTEVARTRAFKKEDPAVELAPQTKPLVPIQRACSTEPVNVTSDSVTWDNSTTLGEEASREPVAEVESPSPAMTSRQQRRRTVIIETTDSTERRRTRLTLDLSDLTRRESENAGEECGSVPWEASPTSHFSFSPSPLSHSTPHSRPASSATMRPPARGILKAQKNVRFSIIPSMHEYDEDEDEDDDDAPTSALYNQRSPTPPPGGRRNSKALSTSGVQADLVTPVLEPGFPKHPAARSVAKASPASSKPTTPTAVLVAPKTPKTPKPKGSGSRNILRTRQSLPPVPIASSRGKDSRNSTGVLKEGTEKPKRFRAVLSMPPQEKNAGRRSMVDPPGDGAKAPIKSKADRSSSVTPSVSPPKGTKMLRSMWTKLRA